MAHTAATPTKLKSGAWGARTDAGVREGDTITITTRAGKSWDARVDRVIWQNDVVAIVATSSLDRPQRSQSSKSSWEPCAECGEARGVVECRDSSGILGLCCRRCASYSHMERSFA